MTNKKIVTKQKPKKGIGEEIYSGTATFGRITSIISAIIGTIISIIMIIIGISLIMHKIKYTEKAIGHITSVNCTEISDDNNKIMWDCGTISGTYIVKVKGIPKTYPFNFDIGKTNIHYTTSSIINVYYNLDNPNKPNKDSDKSDHVIGWVLIVIGLIIIIGGWLWVYLTQKYKVAAAYSGLTSGISLIKGN